jgi:hypothetical protein
MTPGESFANLLFAQTWPFPRLAWKWILPLTMLLGLVLDLSGALHVYALSHLMSQRLSTATAALLVALAACWIILALNDQPQDSATLTSPGFSRLIIGLMIMAWLASLRNGLLLRSSQFSPLEAIAAASGLLLLGLAMLRPPPLIWLMAGAALAGSGLRISLWNSLPIVPANGDMLPLVHSALDNLLAGHSPYAIYRMPWDVPLTYLPLTWLAYAPPYLSGIDIRLSNLVAELLIGLVLLRIAWKNRDQTGNSGCWQVPALGLWAWFFLQPSTLNWSLTTTAPIQWLLLMVLLASILSPRPLLPVLALGLSSAASPLTAVVLPFVSLHWLRQLGWRRTVQHLLGGAAIALLCILPFALWSPQNFVFGTLRWFNDNDLYPRMRWEMDHTWAVMVGFSGIFWRHNLVEYLKIGQAFFIVYLALVYWRAGAMAVPLFAFVVAAFLLFTVFNPVLWPYLYIPALLAALLASSFPAKMMQHPQKGALNYAA